MLIRKRRPKYLESVHHKFKIGWPRSNPGLRVARLHLSHFQVFPWKHSCQTFSVGGWKTRCNSDRKIISHISLATQIIPAPAPHCSTSFMPLILCKKNQLGAHIFLICLLLLRKEINLLRKFVQPS